MAALPQMNNSRHTHCPQNAKKKKKKLFALAQRAVEIAHLETNQKQIVIEHLSHPSYCCMFLR